jgi:hypothetical protein
MMKGLPAIAMTLALSITSSAVRAQYSTRLPMPDAARPSKTDESTAEARRVLNDYATCLVKESERRVHEFLITFPGTAEARKIGADIAESDCLYTGQLRFQPSLFRGSLYEALYSRDFAQKATIDFTAAPALDYSVGKPSGDEAADGQVAIRNFADCVIRADPANARALTLSKVSSSEESRAFEALKPELSGCLTTGIELTFSKPVLRGLVAETLYRLTAASAAAAGQSASN